MRPSARILSIVLLLLVPAACEGATTSPLTDGTPAEQTATETSGPGG